MNAQTPMINALKPVFSWTPMDEAFARYETSRDPAATELDELVEELTSVETAELVRACGALAL